MLNYNELNKIAAMVEDAGNAKARAEMMLRVLEVIAPDAGQITQRAIREAADLLVFGRVGGWADYKPAQHPANDELGWFAADDAGGDAVEFFGGMG